MDARNDAIEYVGRLETAAATLALVRQACRELPLGMALPICCSGLEPLVSSHAERAIDRARAGQRDADDRSLCSSAIEDLVVRIVMEKRRLNLS